MDTSDHVSDGYRNLDNVSYLRFTTANINRADLRERLWTESDFDPGSSVPGRWVQKGGMNVFLLGVNVVRRRLSEVYNGQKVATL